MKTENNKWSATEVMILFFAIIIMVTISVMKFF